MIEHYAPLWHLLKNCFCDAVPSEVCILMTEARWVAPKQLGRYDCSFPLSQGTLQCEIQTRLEQASLIFISAGRGRAVGGVIVSAGNEESDLDFSSCFPECQPQNSWAGNSDSQKGLKGTECCKDTYKTVPCVGF